MRWRLRAVGPQRREGETLTSRRATRASRLCHLPFRVSIGGVLAAPLGLLAESVDLLPVALDLLRTVEQLGTTSQRPSAKRAAARLYEAYASVIDEEPCSAATADSRTGSAALRVTGLEKPEAAVVERDAAIAHRQRARAR